MASYTHSVLSLANNMSSDANNATLPTINYPTVTLQPQLVPIKFYMFYYIFILFMAVTCVLGNALVIKVILGNRALRSPANYFVISLAVSDLLHGISYPVYNVSHLRVREITRTLGLWPVCDTIIVTIVTSQMVSAYSLVGITAVRYMSIRHPLSVRQLLTRTRASLGVTAVWVGSLALNLGLYARPRPGGYVNLCQYESVFGVAEITVLLLALVMIPIVVMVTLYGGIIRAYRKQTQRMRRYSDNARQHETRRLRAVAQEKRLIIMAAILLSFFMISWLPLLVYSYISILCTSCQINDFLRASVRILMFSNSSVNLFVYTGRHRAFRRALSRELLKLCCCLPACREFRRRKLLQHARQIPGMTSPRGSQAERKYSDGTVSLPGGIYVVTGSDEPRAVAGRNGVRPHRRSGIENGAFVMDHAMAASPASELSDNSDDESCMGKENVGFVIDYQAENTTRIAAAIVRRSVSDVGTYSDVSNTSVTSFPFNDVSVPSVSSESDTEAVIKAHRTRAGGINYSKSFQNGSIIHTFL